MRLEKVADACVGIGVGAGTTKENRVVLKLLSATLVALVIGMVAGPRFIRWLSRRGIGQNVRESGPESHSTKQGTPTMGGVLILVAAVIPYCRLRHEDGSQSGGGHPGGRVGTHRFRRRSAQPVAAALFGLNAKAKLILQVPLWAFAVGSLRSTGESTRG